MEEFIRGGINFLDISFLQNHIKDEFLKGNKCSKDLQITFKYLKDNFESSVVDSILEYLEKSEADCDCKVMNLKRYIHMPNSEKVFCKEDENTKGLNKKGTN